MMTDLRKSVQQLAERIDALSLRERGIIFITLLVLLYFAASSLVFGPLRTRQQQLESELKTRLEQVAAINAQVQKSARDATRDPDKENAERLKVLRERIAQVDPQLAGVTQGLVSPRDMARLVEQVLTRNRNLQVIKVESLAPAPLDGQPAGKEAAAPAAADRGVYKHGMRIEVRGRYTDLVRYLRALEALPWKVFWGRATLELEEQPTSRLTLVIYTLSLHQGWIGI
jgi:MSHA biogenesis protein MshJ